MKATSLIEAKARELCGDLPEGHGGIAEAAGDCRCEAIAQGIRAGLDMAIASLEASLAEVTVSMGGAAIQRVKEIR